MEFRNLTPFDALCFGALDPAGAEHRVVAMRVGYRIQPAGERQNGWHLAELIEDAPPALVLADRYQGDEGRSSPYCDSDLAPYKPRCDVLLTGRAHAPNGRPHRRWPVRLRLSVAEPPLVAPAGDHSQTRLRFVLDKTLIVHGPRQFERQQGIIGSRWVIGPAQGASSVPLDYEHAFGGSSRLRHPETGEVLLDEVCYTNPLGCGWCHRDLARLATRLDIDLPRRLPAPQIEYPDAPIDRLFEAQTPAGALQPRDMAAVAETYPWQPAGFGPTDRAWTPRLQRAGTYDADWLEQRWPGLPDDIDFGYWNSAPNDQQIAYPAPGFGIELHNLLPAEQAPGGRLALWLPPHRPFVLARLHTGVMLPLAMITDTVHIDTDALTVNLVHRTWVRAGTPARVLEARFETDPAAPLIRLAKPGTEA